MRNSINKSVKYNKEIVIFIIKVDIIQNIDQIFKELIYNIKDVLFIVSTDWKEVHFVSPSYKDVWGRECDSLLKNPLSWVDSLHSDDKHRVLQYINEKVAGNMNDIIFPDYRVIKPDGTTCWISARCFPIFDKNGTLSRIAGIASDITVRKTLEEERVELVNSLQKAIYEIKTLKGILPLCSFCKKIRNPKDEWENIDDYISQHSEADISHSICPDCFKEHYPEYPDEES